jgi:hypothetical protein
MKGKMSKIYSDCHSLYVKVNGSYFRPVLPAAGYGQPYVQYDREKNTLLLIGDTISTHTVGDKVKTRFIRRTSHCWVGNEVWHDHGAYFRIASDDYAPLATISSEDSWHPFPKD